MGNSAHKFTAKEKRVLITDWVGAAFEKLQGMIIRGIDVSKGRDVSLPLMGRQTKKSNRKVSLIISSLHH